MSFRVHGKSSLRMLKPSQQPIWYGCAKVLRRQDAVRKWWVAQHGRAEAVSGKRTEGDRCQRVCVPLELILKSTEKCWWFKQGSDQIDHRGKNFPTPTALCVCLLPYWRSFQPIFLWILFEFYCLSFLDFNPVNISYFVTDSQIPETAHFFFTLFSLCCSD